MPDPVVSSSDSELRSHVERVLSAHYELDREIGRGGMGIVYLARDRRLKRPVAVKLLPPELAFRTEIRSRFLKEAETAAQLSHPNIVPIYSVDEREGLVFFVMAYIEGENLGHRIHNEGALDCDDTRRILVQVASALSYAHERGVVHRDIKPDNILMSKEDGRAMVTDFGIARAVTEGGDARLTATGMAIGTPAYMSPEQSMGEREIDGRSDLYSLGVVAYQMLSGELPFNAQSTPALLVKHLSERPIPVDERRRGIPVDLSRAVMLMLEKEPASRFPSASALAVALESGNVPALPVPSNVPNQFATLGDRSDSYAVRGPQTQGTQGAFYQPTPAELTNWNSPHVKDFRKKLAPWLVFSAVAIVLSIFTGVDFVGFAGVWSVYIAFKYAKLWTEGYDWRDVLKEPRDRLFFDVVVEWFDSVRAVWDPKKRIEVRERSRLRGNRGGLFERKSPAGAIPASIPAADLATLTGPHAGTVREAAKNRDAIRSLIDTLPSQEREQISDVPASADALYQRIESLAINLAELDRGMAPNAATSVEEEITRLESEANPLDHRSSEERVRRLAYLKRQRRAVADISGKRQQTKDKLESCAVALQNMRYDVLRLKAGGQSYQHITSVAERAMSLAKEVDNAVYVAGEMAKLRGSSGTGVGRARG